MERSNLLRDPLHLAIGRRRVALTPAALGSLVLIILYTVGTVGILVPIHPEFILLTPVNLLISIFIVLLFHPHWTWRTACFLLAAYLWGFSAEVFGVQTGILFGEYAYGTVLGPKIAGTPFMIGVNWMMLSYCIGVTVNYIVREHAPLLKALIAATMLVILDAFIEPVAMQYDFWDWDNNTVPLQNYVGWWLVAFPLQLLFAFLQRDIRNNVAVTLLVLQLLFFAALNIF